MFTIIKNIFAWLLAWFKRFFAKILGLNSTKTSIDEVVGEDNFEFGGNFDEEFGTKLLQKAKQNLIEANYLRDADQRNLSLEVQKNKIRPINGAVRSLDKEFGGKENFQDDAKASKAVLVDKSLANSGGNSSFTNQNFVEKGDAQALKNKQLRKKINEKLIDPDFSKFTSEEIDVSRKLQIKKMALTDIFQGSAKESMLWRQKFSGKEAGPKMAKNPNSAKNKNKLFKLIAAHKMQKDLKNEGFVSFLAKSDTKKDGQQSNKSSSTTLGG